MTTTDPGRPAIDRSSVPIRRSDVLVYHDGIGLLAYSSDRLARLHAGTAGRVVLLVDADEWDARVEEREQWNADLDQLIRERDEARAERDGLRSRLIETAEAIGYSLTADEVAREDAQRWAGVPIRVGEDHVELIAERDEAARLAAQRGDTAERRRRALRAVWDLVESYPPGSDFAKCGLQALFRRTLDDALLDAFGAAETPNAAQPTTEAREATSVDVGVAGEAAVAKPGAVDLMAALRASIEQARQARSGPPEMAEATGEAPCCAEFARTGHAHTEACCYLGEDT